MKIRNNKFILLLAGLLLVVILVALTFSGCVSGQVNPQGWPGVVIGDENIYLASSQGNLVALGIANGNPQWEIPVGEGTSGGGFLSCASGSSAVAVYGTPDLDGDLIYLAGYDGIVHTYSVTTRLSKSSVLDEVDNQPIVGGVVVYDDMVFVGSSNGNLYALEATSLNRLWVFITGDKIWGTPALHDNTVFIGSFDQSVYAVDATTGQEKWSYATQGPVIASPIVIDGKVIITSLDRQIYALDEGTGNLLWQYSGQDTETPSKWFWTGAAVENGLVYAPNMDGQVYVVNAGDGSFVTAFDLGYSIVASPVTFNGKVIVATEEGKIFQLDANAGTKLEIKDFNETVRAPLVISGNALYVHTQTNESVYALNPVTGAVVWYTPLTN